MEPVDWTASGVSAPHQQVFVLQWIELFDETSLDTWQVRVNNVRTLLHEIEQVARVALTDYGPAQFAIPELIDEAIGSIDRDIVIREECPYVRLDLEEMKRDSGRSIGRKSAGEGNGKPTSSDQRAREVDRVPEGDSERLEAVARRARVLRERVSRIYRPSLIKRLREVLGGDGKRREDQLNLTMSLATDFAALGFSVQHLRAATTVLLNPDSDFLSRFDDLVGLFEQNEREFQALFVVQEWEEAVKPTRPGMEIRRRDDALKLVPDAKAPKVLDFFSRANPSDKVVAISTKAMDAFAARTKAESLLASDFAALAFTTFRDPKLKLNHDALVIDKSSNFVTLAPTDRARTKPLVRSRDWHERTNVLLRMSDVLHDEDAHHLSATLQYYRLAVTHPSDEVRLVNLWVAAENLVRRAGSGSILGRVTTYLVPLLATRNIRRVTRGLARRLTAVVRHRQLRDIGLMKKGEGQIDLAHMLTFMRDEKSAEALYALLGDDPLLRFRLHRFVTKTLKDGASAANYLENNAQNIEWQLGRIYRARNSIVHRGEAPQTTRQLLQHLQTYVWTAIRQVTTELEASRGDWSLSDALEHWRSLYAHGVRVARASKEPPVAALVEPGRFLSLSPASQAPPAQSKNQGAAATGTKEMS